MPDLEMARRFCGAESAADEILKICFDAAVEWYRKAGVEEPQEQDAKQALYDFWVCNLTGWMYDNRGAGGDTQIPPYIVASVHQLRRKGGDG